MIRYRLENIGSTIPAPGITESFELMVREPAPSLRVDGLEFLDVVPLGPGNPYRRYVGSEMVDVEITLVETEEEGTLPLEWFALLVTGMLVVGGFSAYARPRRRVAAGLGMSREALILEVARIDDELAEVSQSDARSEILERRATLLTLLRTSD